MTDQDTSPEAVERFGNWIAHNASPTGIDLWNDAYATLSAERDALRAELAVAVDTANQAIDVIASVQNDPIEENALTMCEHEVFDFDVETARAFLARHQKGADT